MEPKTSLSFDIKCAGAFVYFGKPQKVVFYGKGTGWMDGITLSFPRRLLNTHFEKDGAEIEKDCRVSTHALFWSYSSTAACLHQINAPSESLTGLRCL